MDATFFFDNREIAKPSLFATKKMRVNKKERTNELVVGGCVGG